MNSRRRRLTEGTEVLWSTVTYVPVALCAGFLLSISAPVLSTLEVENKPVPMWLVWGFILLFVLAGPLVLRWQVWEPLRLLAREVGDRDALMAHGKVVARRALPFVPLMALPVALLCVSFGGQYFWPQLIAIVGIDHLVGRWRNRPISNAVDDLMARPSGWSKK